MYLRRVVRLVTVCDCGQRTVDPSTHDRRSCTPAKPILHLDFLLPTESRGGWSRVSTGDVTHFLVSRRRDQNSRQTDASTRLSYRHRPYTTDLHSTLLSERSSTASLAEMSPHSSPSMAPKSEPDLFFPSSDSEDEQPVVAGPSASSATPAVQASSSSRAAQSSSRPRLRSSSPDIIAMPSSSTQTPLARKRPSASRTPSQTAPADFTTGYLGEFVCEGWSLSKGKGYCSAGSKVIFERPKAVKTAEEDKSAGSKIKTGPARLVNGKMVHAKGKPANGGKQATLGSMGMGKKATTAVSLTQYFFDVTN